MKRSTLGLTIGLLLVVAVIATSQLFLFAPAYDSESAAAGESSGYYETKVFFATDRAPTEPEPHVFGGSRGREISYGSVVVSIPHDHRPGQIEAPSWWRFWNRSDPSEFVVVLRMDRFGDWSEFRAEAGAVFSEAGSRDVLLFLHGYATDFKAAAQRTAQLAYDLAFPGLPMFYSWPSRGQRAAYPADEATIEWAQPHFAELLRAVLVDSGAENVHVIAHSMGNRVLIETLADLDVEELPDGAARLRQIVLAAPDIDSDVFRRLATAFPGKAERVTLYASENDRAIQASRRFHSYPRAGGTVVIVNGVETVDASDVETGFLGHSYYGESIVADVFSVVRHGLPASQRFGLILQESPSGRYWKIAPGAY